MGALLEMARRAATPKQTASAPGDDWGYELADLLICKYILSWYIARMKAQTAVDFFGGRRKLAQALDISVQAVAYWVKKGAVPRGQAYRLQVMTEQKLLVDSSVYKP